MRLAVTVLVLSSVALAGCGKPDTKPDPTKPIPWLQKPKDPASNAPVPGEAGRKEALSRGGVDVAGQGSSRRACGIPRGYAKVDLADVLASPASHAGEKIQVAGWLGARWSFVGPAVEGVPVCEMHQSFFLGEAESEGFLDDPEERLDLRGPEAFQVGATCLSAEVPDADVAAAWGTVSPAGDEVWLDGACDADALPCTSAVQCPGAMACGGAGICELP